MPNLVLGAGYPMFTEIDFSPYFVLVHRSCTYWWDCCYIFVHNTQYNYDLASFIPQTEKDFIPDLMEFII